ncbi:MAG: hypothetical protein GX328_02545 [Clostridiaceae bacterium]|nr:hypothetical protein [Clostridiaceae bacterium]
MQYQSTIQASRKYTFSQMLRESVPMHGGLFVPCELPQLDQKFLNQLKPLSIQDRAIRILGLFAPELSEIQINQICQTAFNAANFQSELLYQVKPLNPYVTNPLFLFMERGQTSCYTDLTHAFSLACLQTVLKENEQWFIVAGESLQSIKSLVALHLNNSAWQPVLITDNKATNNYILKEIQHIHNVVVQSQDCLPLKLYTANGRVQDVEYFTQNLFYQEKLRLGLKEQNKFVAAVGSLSFTHHLALIIILLSAYLDLLNQELIDEREDFGFAFPNMNLDFLYAGQLLQSMGLPISDLIAASNNNRAIDDFLRQGKYKLKRRFSRTITPALDQIYIPNLERILFEVTEHDCQITYQIMNELFKSERINLVPEIKQKISDLVQSGYAGNNQIVEQIRDWYLRTDYLFDPYTALTLAVLERFEQNSSKTKKMIVPVTESPLLSVQVSAEAIFEQDKKENRNYNQLLEEVSEESGIEIPFAALSDEQAPEVVNLDLEQMNERVQADLLKVGQD